MAGLRESVFLFDVAINFILLIGVVWSIAFPEKRIWPPPNKWSWQYLASWALFCAAFILNGLLLVLDWNSWVIPFELRYLIGIPCMVVGSLIVSWGMVTLGIRNTSGLRDGFILSGPYRFTRNPQYLGDMILFLGIILVSNSLYVSIVHELMILVFLLLPFTEEIWLEKQYGEEYKNYKRNTARFF